MGAPFQRATPTRRAPPGAVGTLPPPPGRPVVPGLLWAHYMPALFVDSGQNKGIGVPGTEYFLVGLIGFQLKSAVHGRIQHSGAFMYGLDRRYQGELPVPSSLQGRPRGRS